jgi:hypothetical protein
MKCGADYIWAGAVTEWGRCEYLFSHGLAAPAWDGWHGGGREGGRAVGREEDARVGPRRRLPAFVVEFNKAIVLLQG